jgi:ABC-type sugar transport system substrate-binding protein
MGRTVCAAVFLLLSQAVGVFASGSTQQASGGGQFTIGFAQSGLQTNSIFIDALRAIEDNYVKGKGYRLITADLLENGPAKMITFLENCVATNARVVIFQNIAEDAYADQLQQLKDKGVILLATDTAGKIAQYSLEVDNYNVGVSIGREAGKWAKANAGSKKAAICGYSLLDFLVVRANGIKDGFKEACPEGQVVYEVDAGYVQQGVAAGEALIQAHPDIQVVMGINDSGPVGMLEAFKAAGWTTADHNIGLFGCDASVDAVRALKEEGMFKCTISLDLMSTLLATTDAAIASAETGKIDAAIAHKVYPQLPIYLSNIGDIR